MAENHDALYRAAQATIKPFEFDDRVADVFPNMIRRSVPGYALTVSMLGVIAAQYAQAGSNIYDLGCSLGAATLAMRHSLAVDGCRIIAADNSEAMVRRCELAVARDRAPVPVEVQCRDIREIAIEDASVVALNFTLQFIPVAERLPVLQAIHAGLRAGGVLVLSEKIIVADAAAHQRLTDLHNQFKTLNGYNDLEIARKRTALENVLVPETIDQHQTRLRGVGFKSVDNWLRCLNFVSFIAVK